MVRRKQAPATDLMIPEHLRVDSALLAADPVEWHRQRLTWSQTHLDKLRESPLAFLMETREASRQATRR